MIFNLLLSFSSLVIVVDVEIYFEACFHSLSLFNNKFGRSFIDDRVHLIIINVDVFNLFLKWELLLLASEDDLE